VSELVTPELSRTLNAIGLLAVSGVLAGAFWFQLVWGELPCPLCLLQRVGFAAVGFGLALNLIYGARPSHYAVMLLGALFGLSVSVRQIFLHIVPGTGHYGSAVLGYHFYTWAGIIYFLVLAGTAAMLLFDGQYKLGADGKTPNLVLKSLAGVAVAVLMVVLIGNALSALLECGPLICDDPPTDYKFLDKVEQQ